MENNTPQPEEKMSKEEIFREEIRNLIIEWYTNCPKAMMFTTKVIKRYKETFPDDNIMHEIDSRL